MNHLGAHYLPSHRIEGRGEPVVLLNGGLMTMSSWDRIARALADGFRVIRFDFRGQLCSPDRPPADLAGHAEDLAALLDHLEIERAHVIGTSFGGLVGLVFAATRPERTRSLVAATVSDVATGPFREGVSSLRKACEGVVLGGDPGSLFDTMTPTFYSPDWRLRNETELALRREQFTTLPLAWFQGIADLLVALEDFDLGPLLPAIACPTLVLAAEKDDIMAPERTRALASGIRGALLEVLDGAGHALVVEDPERFASRCLAFLRRVGSIPS